MQPMAIHPKVNVPSVPMVTQSVFTQSTMFIVEHKMLGRFLRLNLPRFFSAPGKDT